MPGVSRSSLSSWEQFQIVPYALAGRDYLEGTLVATLLGL
jgi:hypothetical protein